MKIVNLFSLILICCCLAGANEKATGHDVVLKPRASELKFFPCRDCHTNNSLATKPVQGKAPHARIRLEHAPELARCRDCHEPADWQRLSLLTGEAVEFNRVADLCVQCHGIVGRDWEKGIHGKTTGGWKDHRSRWTCVECHDPHKPRFPNMRALPQPSFPKLGIKK